MAHNRNLMNAYNAIDSSSYGSDSSEAYHGWMSQFCVEPRNDANTCCLGFWVPYALYGKTHWRLKRVNRGQDATDESWKSSDGCNGPCWGWWALSCIGCAHPCAGVVTGLQRAQIRGTYGIKGNCASDIALGVFCASCTQIQNDREVRAREGDASMRYNLKYRHSHQKFVNHQPKPEVPMTYVSPRQASEHSLENPLAHAQYHKEASNKLQKHYHEPSVRQSSPASHLRKVEGRNPYQPHEEPSGQRSEKIYPMQTAPTGPIILVTQHQDQKIQAEIPSTTFALRDEKLTPDILSTKPRSKEKSGKRVKIFGLGKASPPRQPKIPEETVQDGFESLYQQHALAEDGAIDVEEDITIRPTLVTHALDECTKADVESPTEEKRDTTPQHTILECVTVEEKSQVNSTSSCPAQHPVAECEAVAVEYTLPRTIFQHQLSECDTVPASEASTQAQELSYVHDFTDCPVDKAVLDYYEKEEKKAQEHGLADYIRTSLPAGLIQSNNPYAQHTLADCSENELAPPATSSNLDLDLQQNLVDCSEDELRAPTSPSNHRSSSYNHDKSKQKSQKLREHRLVSCPTPPAVTSHHVVENARVNTSGESEATQRPVQKAHHSKSKQKIRAEQAGQSTDGVDSAGSGPTSQESTEGSERVGRRHKRRHKPSRNTRRPVVQFPLAATDGNEREGSEATQLSLDQAFATSGSKQEKGWQGRKSESSPLTATISGKNPESVHTEEDPRSPVATSKGVFGLLSKLAGGSNDRLPH
ncbi:hypothetical protein BUE80_DR011101 [Diplocarpon rosae]|nr:hypothetical protein BUE80_DR011101 [Diplocarpon rosae]